MTRGRHWRAPYASRPAVTRSTPAPGHVAAPAGTQAPWRAGLADAGHALLTVVWVLVKFALFCAVTAVTGGLGGLALLILLRSEK